MRRVAVLGAGVMGAQIAAHFVNAGVPALLFDLASREGPPNAMAAAGIARLLKLEPAPLATRERAGYIDAANYDSDLSRLCECDLVIEAIGERFDWKRDLYGRIAAHVAPGAVLASNTSGLSLAALAGALPAAMRPRFCGMHFFNPPRYMHLVELIPTADTAPVLIDALETFLTTTLGKGVVRAKDTPNFIANRIGIFSVLATMHHADRLGLGFDVVDALTGPAIGRAKSATYRTSDIVGLDTMVHVIETMRTALPDDPFHPLFATPPLLAALVAKGALGQKSGAGFFRKRGNAIEVLDRAADDYVALQSTVAPDVLRLLGASDARARLGGLRESTHPHAQLLWSIHRDLFHYAAFHLASIADNARDVDLAIRWGFGWKRGPFEVWQEAGWRDVAGWIADDIAAGRTLARLPLPAWVGASKIVECGGVHAAGGSFSPQRDTFAARSTLPVYRRQRFPDPLLAERFDAGTTIFENAAIRFWHTGDDVGIVSFRTKQHTISDEVLDGLLESIERAERECAGLVIWQPREPFSLGANLAAIAPAIEARAWGGIEATVAKFQQAGQRLRYAQVPTVAAVRGMALGGSVEFILHCDRTVAALESYIGLVETGVGLLPAGGGSKELAVRAAAEVRRGATGGQLDLFPFLRTYFLNVAKATVSKSAHEARELGYLQASDPIVMHADEVLHVALATARSLADAAYRPPLPPRDVPVAGRTGVATLTMLLVNLREGGFITPYDFEVGVRLARVMCGGDVDAGSTVDEAWLLALERREFMALLHDERTHARINHTLATGKPLRN